MWPSDKNATHIPILIFLRKKLQQKKDGLKSSKSQQSHLSFWVLNHQIEVQLTQQYPH